MTEASDVKAQTIVAHHLDRLRELLLLVDLDAVERVGQVLREARDGGHTIFVAGNGGSSATAAHWVNDLGKATKRSGRPALRVLGLADNVPWLTALANDEGYERAFAGQLENFVEPDDVLVAISASGNSMNLVHAVDLAKARGATTVGFLGFNGGKLRGMVDEAVWVRTEPGAYELVEDVHHALCHALTVFLVQDKA